MGKYKDLSDFHTGSVVMARRLVRASPKQQALWGVPCMRLLVPACESATESWVPKAH